MLIPTDPAKMFRYLLKATIEPIIHNGLCIASKPNRIRS